MRGHAESASARDAGEVHVKPKTVENRVDVPASAAAVWTRVIHPDGINYEMRPWMTMRLPRSAAGLTVETIPLGQPIGRAWLRLFGLIPFEFDHLTVVELEVGVRFLERSTMLSMRHWQHERTLIPVAGGTQVHDRVTLQPRLPIPGLGAVLARVVDAFFRHRHRRLHRYFAAHR
jgi:ligand-binding SRPBCC domain-containing protein